MSLRELNVKASYDSDEDDILNDFYIPALSQATTYKRLAGYFNSNSFAIAAKGIAKFICNGGKMQLITNIILSREDYEKIKEVTESKIIEEAERVFIEDVDTIKDELIKDHVRMLGWLLKNKRLEIKVAVVKDGDGIQHQKTGILEDKDGNIISFSGSDNETQSGWIYNIENFHVFCNWKDGETSHMRKDLERFDKFWNDLAKRTKVFSISEAVEKELIKIAPKDAREFEDLRRKVDSKLTSITKRESTEETSDLWLHQNEAKKTFFEMKNGILQMATGTGKTRVSIGILNSLFEHNNIDSAIVTTYGTDLLDQWYLELIERSSNKFIVYRDYENHHEILDYLLNRNKSVLLVSWQNLHKVLEQIESFERMLIIIDEIHGFGSEELRNKLGGKIKKIKYRLGLSATPEREYDEEGNKFIEEEVGKVIFDFVIVDAIERGILCEFNYIPLHFRLSDEDKKAIKKVYRRYAARIKNGILENEAKRYLYIEIAKVRKLSKNKIPVFVNFLMSNQNILVNCIIFVEDMKYGKFVQDIIVNYNQNYHTYYSNDEKKNLSKFASGEFSILITCKRISQGIDIRSIKNVILFSASRAKLETIQRIGRCLRIDPENPSKVANVVDFITTNEKGADSDDDEDYENTDEARERWLINTSKTRRLKHEG